MVQWFQNIPIAVFFLLVFRCYRSQLPSSGSPILNVKLQQCNHLCKAQFEHGMLYESVECWETPEVIFDSDNDHFNTKIVETLTAPHFSCHQGKRPISHRPAGRNTCSAISSRCYSSRVPSPQLKLLLPEYRPVKAAFFSIKVQALQLTM